MDYAEFEKIAQDIVADSNETDDAIKKTFDMIDESKKGYISTSDMKKIMVKLGDPLTDEEINAVIKEITKGQTDKITFNDFKKAMSKQTK